MPARIHVLDDLTINKITAGEVIENPSSVVKELIENSLDAGAQSITLEIQAGGRVLIRVSDDGCGMGKDDAILCLERHATSKLKSIHDLQTLTSMGFRGEALPSIASISKFSILTSEGGKGHLVRVEGGRLFACDEAICPQGTTVEVKDLFYNIPVRKKFLKSPVADENDILKIFLLEALARPEVKFQLLLNQRLNKLLQSADPATRIEGALGSTYFKELLPLNRSEGHYHLGGYIGKPFASRQNRTGQYLFLNGRPIVSSVLSWAVKDAYSTHIPTGRHPLFVLWLTLPPDQLDINVHPQKKEVRLRQEAEIKKLIFLAVQEALARSRTPHPVEWALSTHHNSFERMTPLPWDLPQDLPLDFPEAPTRAPEETLQLPIPPEKFSTPTVLATLKGFILIETVEKGRILLVDQQRAHARILFERLEKGEERPFEKVALLLPLTLELSPSDALQLKEHLSELRSIGFDIREFGPHTFAIDAYPTPYGKDSIIDLIHAFLEESRWPASCLKSRFAEKSSLLSISSEKNLSKEEACRLVEDLFHCELPWESPLGKPTAVPLDPEYLAKQFQK